MTVYYPVAVDLRNRACVVFGGGAMAEAKVLTLLETGAVITVVSSNPSEQLNDLAASGRIVLRRRPYAAGDLEGAWLAFAADDDRRSNAAIRGEAEARRVLLNAVDDLPNCSFIVPAILRQGDLTVAISTAGKSPALAVRLRDRIQALLGPEYATFLTLLGDARGDIARRVPEFRTRLTLWYRIIDSDVLDFVRRGDNTGARHRITALTDEAVGEDSRCVTVAAPQQRS